MVVVGSHLGHVNESQPTTRLNFLFKKKRKEETSAYRVVDNRTHRGSVHIYNANSAHEAAATDDLHAGGERGKREGGDVSFNSGHRHNGNESRRRTSVMPPFW